MSWRLACSLALPALLAFFAGGPAHALEGLSGGSRDVLSGNASSRTFLMPEEAFKVSPSAASAGHLTVQFSPAPGYYLYRDRIKIAAPNPIPPAQIAFPAAESKQDPSFGRVWVYHHPFAAAVTLPGSLPSRLDVSYQGCAERGICYPPTTQHFALAADGQTYRPLSVDNAYQSGPPSADSANPNDYLAFLKGARPGWVLLSFFGFGLLLALTPCVFPMIPILSGIIAGQGSDITKKRAFGLSLTYVLGMAVTYALAGILAGLSGTMLSNTLQTPPVQIGTAILFILLALSMFDVYQLQLPVALQSRLNGVSNRLPGGRHMGVGLMGVLSALVVGPCVAAPLAGSLIYIAQTRDVILGGSALFILALGMGSPLLVIGTSAGALMPRAGRWMVWIKRFFGVMLLGVALWIVMPLLGSRLASNGPHFEPVSSVAQLDRALQQAAQDGRPAMLDFYADWCVSCVEMEKEVFPRPEVKAALGQALLLRADVTGNTPDDRALLARFGLFGPPGTLFFNREGRELGDQRLVGFVPAAQFEAHLRTALR
ncbi:MAG: protein-disulfide reductase DsbD [Betaproteobacteria bacterium]|nr:protein-disulfide reductase DsbD [Betaproteobacteria bacterium]MDE2622181.1 protein-disulfide reductase DsbD [Betaproteobacteria bacterium]